MLVGKSDSYHFQAHFLRQTCLKYVNLISYLFSMLTSFYNLALLKSCDYVYW